MTIDDLKKHPLYKLLGSDQLRKFVEEMCTNGFDKLEAARVAYGSDNEDSIKTQANRALKNQAVRQLIALCQGRPNREEYLIALNTRAAMADDDGVAFDFYELYAKVEGWLTKPTDKPVSPGESLEPKSIYDLADELDEKEKKRKK